MKYGYSSRRSSRPPKIGATFGLGSTVLPATCTSITSQVRPRYVSRDPYRKSDRAMAPGDGQHRFGPEGHDIFGSTPAVPFGKATVTYRIGTEVHQATGTGYHDHNWCTKEMGQMLDHWWWAKGQVGPYMFISAHIVTAKEYGHSPVHFFMLSRDGKVVADDDEKVSFTTSGSQIDEHTGKPVPDEICFHYLDGDTRYTMRLASEDDGQSEDPRFCQRMAEGGRGDDPLSWRIRAIPSARNAGMLQGGAGRRALRGGRVSSRCISDKKSTLSSRTTVLLPGGPESDVMGF